jgi:hypothetical protein
MEVEIEDLMNAINPLDLVYISITFHPTAAECSYLKCTKTFSKIDHLLDHKISLNMY